MEAQGRGRADGRLAHGERPPKETRASRGRSRRRAMRSATWSTHTPPSLGSRTRCCRTAPAASSGPTPRPSRRPPRARTGQPPDFHVVLTNPAGEQAYPIAATVFALLSRTAPAARTRPALDFFRWSLRKGSGTATTLGYVPLPSGAGAAGRSLLGADLSGRELIAGACTSGGSEPPDRWHWDPAKC